jgi:hypothetical protein
MNLRLFNENAGNIPASKNYSRNESEAVCEMNPRLSEIAGFIRAINPLNFQFEITAEIGSLFLMNKIRFYI